MVVTTAPAALASVPRLWPDSTIVCVGTGPSLTQADVDACRDRARVIAIKDAIRFAPWADVLYCGEDRWWTHYGPDLTYTGLRYTIHPLCGQWATVLQMGPAVGISTDPTALAWGKHSGYQALNLATLLGAKRVVLLGYDMRASATGDPNVHGTHPYARRSSPFGWSEYYDEMRAPLKAIGVEVINATLGSAITSFPTGPLVEALA